jgi:type II secretory pathway pseudopilin PulG
MKRSQETASRWRGYCLAELLLVLSIISMCLTLGAESVFGGLRRQQAQCIAQLAQTAVARAQVGALWQGGSFEVSLDRGGLTVAHDDGASSCSSEWFDVSAIIRANVARWTTKDGVLLHVLGPFASPDSGGSLYVDGGGVTYRVVVRPGSGLTARVRSGR